jgi:hypothetical protein
LHTSKVIIFLEPRPLKELINCLPSFLNNMSTPDVRKELKVRLLRILYERRDCNTLGVSFFDLAKELGLDNRSAEDLVRELEYEYLVKFNAQYLAITPYGMDEIEAVDSHRPEVYELQSNRLMVLRKYYDIRDDYYGAASSEIAQQVGLEEKAVEDIVWYYQRKGFLKAPMIGSKVKITYDGAKEVERHPK